MTDSALERLTDTSTYTQTDRKRQIESEKERCATGKNMDVNTEASFIRTDERTKQLMRFRYVCQHRQQADTTFRLIHYWVAEAGLDRKR